MKALRHRCRNRRCRSKLKAPVENEHQAFCAPGCHASFYLHRCRVCEKPLRDRRGGRLYCRPPNKCKQEAAKWPQKYGFQPVPVPQAAFTPSESRSAHSTGLKIGIEGHPPSHRCLRDWRWAGVEIFDWSLYDKDGLTIARLVLDKDGRYHLRGPVTWPRLSWPDLNEAMRGAESVALSALGVDPKLAARIQKDNSTPHPMGPPLNRQPSRETATPSDWKPGDGATMPDIPAFLRRRA